MLEVQNTTKINKSKLTQEMIQEMAPQGPSTLFSATGFSWKMKQNSIYSFIDIL